MPAHIGTYALADRVDEGAHIAGYALAGECWFLAAVASPDGRWVLVLARKWPVLQGSGT